VRGGDGSLAIGVAIARPLRLDRVRDRVRDMVRNRDMSIGLGIRLGLEI